MKVAKQTQGDLLRGADAGRNGYETGMYDAFLACVQASARGVKLPPFTVGERVRQISIAASTTDELEQAVDAAQRKGWAPVELMRGTDVQTGWPCIWMSKLVGDTATT